MSPLREEARCGGKDRSIPPAAIGVRARRAREVAVVAKRVGCTSPLLAAPRTEARSPFPHGVARSPRASAEQHVGAEGAEDELVSASRRRRAAAEPGPPEADRPRRESTA